MRKKKLTKAEFGMNVVIVILSVGLVIAAYWMVFNLVLVKYPMNEQSFAYDLREEKYVQLVADYRINMHEGAEDKKELQEYYAVAEYFRTASLYHAYEEAGNDYMSQMYKTKAKYAAQNMGDFAVFKDKIDLKLGIR